MIEKILVISNKPEAIKMLTVGASNISNETILIYGGEQSVCAKANKAIYIGNLDEMSVVQIASSVAKIAADIAPNIVLTDNSRDGRLISAAVAVALKCSVISDVLSVSEENGLVVTERMVYGGSAIKTEKAENAVICCGAGVFESEVDCDTIAPETVELEKTEAIVFNGKRAKEVSTTNLAAAKKVIVVGRGAGTEEGVAAAQELADILGAELGCTRPVAEEAKVMAKERYIGVSGVIVKPAVLLSLGASGQVQHTVGTNQSGIIIAADKDKRAAIFDNCDYGLIGDCQQAIAAIKERVTK